MDVVDPDAHLVDVQIDANALGVLAGWHGERWQEALDPAVDPALIDEDAAVGRRRRSSGDNAHTIGRQVHHLISEHASCERGG